MPIGNLLAAVINAVSYVLGPVGVLLDSILNGLLSAI